MKDRQPTQILSNGAIRYGIYNADGTLNHYEYMKRDDAPTVDGTPLNKANLLSDATARKLWPGSTRPEDPTVNDAFAKLSTGMHRVGDIEITSRSAPSAAWLPCDGRYVSQADYPELFDVLRTTASQGDWSTQIVNADINPSKASDTISYANGVWFRVRPQVDTQYTADSKTARMWYSTDNMQSWHETAVLDNVIRINTVHYYAQKYVSICVYKDPEILNTSYYYIYYADQPSGPWNFGAQFERNMTYNNSYGYSDPDVVTDGTVFYLTWLHQGEMRSSVDLLASTWTSTSLGIYRIRSMTYNEYDGYFYGAKGESDTNINFQIARTKTPTNHSSWQVIYSATGSYTVVRASGNIIYAADVGSGSSTTNYAYSTDGGATFKQASLSKKAGAPIISDGIVAMSADTPGNNTGSRMDPVLLYSDDLNNGFISMSAPYVASFAGNGTGLIVGAIESNGSDTRNIYRDFTYDAKKIPKITPDSRSHAYIKALEE